MIERYIRTIKERSRCICYKLPYDPYTKLITEEIILGVTKILNVFPNKGGINLDLSPDAIVLGTPKLDYNNIQVVFWVTC